MDNERRKNRPARPEDRRPRREEPPMRGFDADGEDLGFIEGRNAVTEALRAGRPLNKVFVAKGDTDAALRRLISMSRDAGAVVIETDKRKLDQMSATGAHQGIIAVASVKEYCSVQDILAIARERGEPPFVILCDEVSDAHNLGAIIRTAECAGAHGVVIPKRRSAGLSAIISKTSAGAVEHMAVARVANLAAAIRELQDAGVWIYGTAADGEHDLWHTDLTGPMALIIGSEGEGMRRLVSESCDFHLSIPMRGKVSSLNASASAAIVIYEALRQRQK